MAYEPYDWCEALKVAAEKLIIGQYYMNPQTGALLQNHDQVMGTAKEDHVMVVNRNTGQLDTRVDAKCVYKLCFKALRQYVVLPTGADLLCRVSGNIVCYEDDGSLYVHHVNIVRNDLTIQDLSCPTDAFIVDNRNDYVKELDIVVWQHDNYGLWIDKTGNPIDYAKIQLNGHDRIGNSLDGNYFNYVQPYQHFNNTPADGINVYSFALRPAEHQPSGTCNFSRIDTTELFINFVRWCNSCRRDTFRDYLDSETRIDVFTVNYNVLRIMSGMGGLAYSN
jgi:hypothetical protein